MIISLTTLPTGKRYSDSYGKWLDIFQTIATKGPGVQVNDAPRCWVPLILYMRGRIGIPKAHFDCDEWVFDPLGAYLQARKVGKVRQYVEHMCTLRPELVDALWKVDNQWRLPAGPDHTWQDEFVLTTYNGYYRPEIRSYLTCLHRYRKPEGVHSAVITNCSADKPYPAPLHKAIRGLLPRSGWHMVIATGVLGVVPEELWGIMPLYDSGIANFWRCTEEWTDYLERNHYRHLVIYTEFYSRALQRALQRVKDPPAVTWAISPGAYYDYLPLLDPGLLGKLKTAVQNVDKPLIIKGLTPFSLGNLTPLS